MPNYANYDVVSDRITLIDAAQDPDKDFPLGFDPSINVGIRSVLSYMVDPGSPGVTFKMSIVNFDIPDSAQQIITPVVVSTQLPSLSPHVRQEIIDANVSLTPLNLKEPLMNTPFTPGSRCPGLKNTSLTRPPRQG